jgi:exodeoxyribonuclease VII large subunit
VGEVSSITDRSGGAVFFTISDEEEQAVLNCVIWRNVYRGLGFKLEEGMKIKMSGHPNIYKPRGNLSYVAHSIIPTGEGALLKAFEELKKKLQEEGFFAVERKRELPSYITKIGLITAKQSDAIKDFETHLGNFGATVYVHDVRVEGFNAVDNIVKAIKNFNESSLDLEVLVLTRGGGSLESLQAFNSEAVARAIHASKIPILSAIGHERDITISDLVSDVRGSTPTDAGKILSKDWREAENKLQRTNENVIYAFNNALMKNYDRIEYQKEKILNRFTHLLKAERNKLRNISSSLFLYFQNIFRKIYILSKNMENNFYKYKSQINQTKRSLNSMSGLLISEYKHNLKNSKNRINQLKQLLKSNDPKKKLEQGYTLTRNKEGKIIKSIINVKENDILSTYFTDGEAKSTVIDISKQERKKDD